MNSLVLSSSVMVCQDCCDHVAQLTILDYFRDCVKAESSDICQNNGHTERPESSGLPWTLGVYLTGMSETPSIHL